MIVTPISSAQIHPSLHIPYLLEKTILPRRQGTPSVSSLAMTTESTPPSTLMTVNFFLTHPMLDEIHQVLTATSDSNECSTVYIYHSFLSITMKHRYTPERLIHSEQHQNLSNQILFNHLRITTSSPLIPRDRSLHLTIYNTIYALTPPCATTMDTPHRIQLFINPYNRIPYLLHIHDVDELTTRRLEVITRSCEQWTSMSV